MRKNTDKASKSPGVNSQRPSRTPRTPRMEQSYRSEYYSVPPETSRIKISSYKFTCTIRNFECITRLSSE